MVKQGELCFSSIHIPRSHVSLQLKHLVKLSTFPTMLSFGLNFRIKGGV